MLNKEKAVCFCGHRSEKLPKFTNELDQLRVKLYEEIDKAVNDGFDTFMFGACYGFDLMCAEMVLLRKMAVKQSDPKRIRLIAVLPFEDQASKWNEHDRELYYNILSKCDEVLTLSTKFNKNCYYKRNYYMVDNSGRIICYYDGSKSGTGNTMKYAMGKGCKIFNIYNQITNKYPPA